MNVCVHVCALSSHTCSDICSEPHSPDTRDCLEIASMGSRCLCLQQGSGGGRQKRSREGVEVEGRKPPGSFLTICTTLILCHTVEHGQASREQCTHSKVELMAYPGNDGEKDKLWSW